MFFISAVFASLAACGPKEAPVSACSPGTLRDGDGACVPEACGVGPRGAPGEDADAVWVAAGASGGDGSRDAPLGSIQDGLDLAADRGFDQVHVGAGVFTERLVVGEEHEDIHLRGRCRTMTVLDASEFDEYGGVSVELGGAGDDFGLEDLTVRGAHFGIDALRGQLVVERVDVVESRAGGVFVQSGARIELLDSSIRDTRETEPGSGAGVQIEGGHLLAEATTFSGNTGTGLLILGGTVTLTDAIVAEQRRAAGDLFGQGLEIQAGTLEGDGVQVVGNYNAALVVFGGTVNLQNARFADTQPDRDGLFGRGLDVRGGQVALTDSVVENNHDTGILAANSSISLTRVEVRGTQPDLSGAFGIGLHLDEGTTATLDTVTLKENHFVGLYAIGAQILASDVEISDTRLDGGGLYGRGMDLSRGATFDGAEIRILNSHDVGLIAKDSEVRVTGLTLAGTREGGHSPSGTGIYLERSTLELSSGALTDNVSVGVVATDSTLVLSGVDVEGVLPDRFALQGRGMELWNGSRATLSGCRILDTYNDALIVSDSSEIAIEDLEIRGVARVGYASSARGISGQLGARIEASELRITEVDGPGLYLFGATADCSQCTIINNRFAGVVLQRKPSPTPSRTPRPDPLHARRHPGAKSCRNDGRGRRLAMRLNALRRAA